MFIAPTVPDMNNPVAERNKNTKCPIDAHCHRHCRRDPRITKDCIEVLSFRVFFDFGKKFELKLIENTTEIYPSSNQYY